MGFLDNVISSAESQVQSSTERSINSKISGSIGGIGNNSNKSQSQVDKCPKCSAALPSPMPKFCPKCGAKLFITCSKCNNDFPLGTKFCPNDGTKLS